MKKIVLVGIIGILFLIAGVLVYKTSTTPPPPETGSENLNELLRETPISWINLHSSSPDTILVGQDQIIEPDLEDQRDRISDNSIRVYPFNDHLVTYRFGYPNVDVLTTEGRFLDTIGSDVLRRPSSIQSDGYQLYIHDYDRKRMHIYDADFSEVGDFRFEEPYYTPGSVVMSNSHIAFQQDEASGFRVSQTEEHLLSVVEIEDPDKEVMEAIPRIVPSGKHPGAFNNLKLAMNSTNRLVAAFPALPYLLIYDDFVHSNSVVLRSGRFNEVENPDLNPFDPVMGEAVRVNSLMDNVQVLENGDILLFSFGTLHHIRQGYTGSYSLEKEYILIRENTGQQITSVNSIGQFVGRNNPLYFSGKGMIYEINLPG